MSENSCICVCFGYFLSTEVTFSHKITENCEILKSILLRDLGPLCKQGKEIRSAEIVKHSPVKIRMCSRPPLICKAALMPHCVLPLLI